MAAEGHYRGVVVTKGRLSFMTDRVEEEKQLRDRAALRLRDKQVFGAP